ncbi:MAG TPA: response regulator transcription factor [Flavobacteriaceae bacterium]|nr:response regulator transcription factor [Flavobacteriaceae bacterium]
MKKINLGIVEDNILVGEMLQFYFSKDESFEVKFWAVSSEKIPFDRIDDLDIVLCDIGLPGKSGMEVTYLLKQKNPKIHIVMFTVFEEEEKIFQSLKAGASGYLLKSTPLAEIKAGLLDVLNNGAAISPMIAKKVFNYFNLADNSKSNSQNLSPREFDVLSQVLAGYTNKQIAEHLSISLETIKSHVRKIYEKLQLSSRSELFHYYKS